MIELEGFYKQVITSVHPLIQDHGFKKKKKSSYYKQEFGNWGVINFQRSSTNTSSLIKFTVNLGIASARLLNFYDSAYSGREPDIWDCHWRTRLSDLVEGDDFWYVIESGTSIDTLSLNIRENLLAYAFPELDKYFDDNMLRDHWLSGYSSNLTEMQQLMNLSVLLRELGPLDLLEPTISRIKQLSAGKSTAFTAELHLQKLSGK